MHGICFIIHLWISILRYFVLCLRCLQTNGVAPGADGSHQKCCLRCEDCHMWRHQTGMFPSPADTLLCGFCRAVRVCWYTPPWLIMYSGSLCVCGDLTGVFQNLDEGKGQTETTNRSKQHTEIFMTVSFWWLTLKLMFANFIQNCGV